MVAQIPTPTQIEYPDSDGKPMSDNTKQFRWITTIKYNLDWLFTNDENVFVAGDLLWYPVEGNPKRRVAPDVMVAFDRPKGDSPEATLCERGSYKQWLEGDIAPQVVFEILSPGNTANEMASKLAFYDRHDVEEYYIYDPDTNTLTGWERENGYLAEILVMQDWCSPRLGIRFDLITPPELQIYQPNGEIFLSFEQVSQRLAATTRELENALQALSTREQEIKAQSDRNQQLAAKLRELGIDPDTL
jgi:Uma2 family endonuclease